MAPVALDPQVKYTPMLVVASHLLTVVYLTYTTGIGLYRSYKNLSPSQDVRLRAERRKKLVPVFAGLALLGLIVASHSSLTYATLSYRVWADERGIRVPDSIFASSANVTDPSNATQLHISRWLTDVPVYADAFEIVVEKARRFWWGQQIDLSMVAWSMLLAIEGRRRRIPFLWAYLSLAHLVSLSYAQNLFYVALLLTPAPLPVAAQPSTRLSRLGDKIFPPRPANWCANPGLFLAVILFNYLVIFLLPYGAATPSFTTVMGLTRALTFAPLLIQSAVPESWGTVHPHPHKAYGAFTDLFRFISIFSVLLHAKASLVGLAYNVPDAHYHRHSALLPWDVEERTKWERTTTAVGKILGSTADHPVVAAIGRDVLLCGLSLGLWAAVRGLDTSKILTSTIPLYKKGLESEGSEAADITNSDLSPSGTSPVKAEAEPPSPVRRRARTAKAKGTSTDETNDDAATSSQRRRGRQRKAKADPEEEPGDTLYKPSPSVAASVAEGDVIPVDGLDWESSALAWGLTAFGGLGCGSAGVFGGECIAR